MNSLRNSIFALFFIFIFNGKSAFAQSAFDSVLYKSVLINSKIILCDDYQERWKFALIVRFLDYDSVNRKLFYTATLIDHRSVLTQTSLIAYAKIRDAHFFFTGLPEPLKLIQSNSISDSSIIQKKMEEVLLPGSSSDVNYRLSYTFFEVNYSKDFKTFKAKYRLVFPVAGHPLRERPIQRVSPVDCLYGLDSTSIYEPCRDFFSNYDKKEVLKLFKGKFKIKCK